MARLRLRVEPDKRHHPGLDLLMGPTDAPGEYSAAELEVLWPTYRGEIMDGPNGRQGGKRPWAWWTFECGEQCPDDPADEAVRLAELGELTAAEVAALREAALDAGLRVGTPGEQISGGWRQTPGAVSLDREAVELWERVEAALR